MGKGKDDSLLDVYVRRAEFLCARYILSTEWPCGVGWSIVNQSIKTLICSQTEAYWAEPNTKHLRSPLLLVAAEFQLVSLPKSEIVCVVPHFILLFASPMLSPSLLGFLRSLYDMYKWSKSSDRTPFGSHPNMPKVTFFKNSCVAQEPIRFRPLWTRIKISLNIRYQANRIYDLTNTYH